MEDQHIQSQILGDVTDQHLKHCVICLETISEHSVTNPCAHSFDFLCIVNWLERTPTCPLCITQVKAVHYGHPDDHTFKVYNVPAQPDSPASGEATETTPNSHQQQQESQERQLQPTRSRDNDALSTGLLTDDPLLFRRHIYHRQLYSLHIGSNQVSRFQEFTPKRFRKDGELISRARKWIRRESQVFEYLAEPSEITPQCGSKAWWIGNPEYLLEWIIAMLKSVNLKDSSGKAEDMLQEILGRNNARLFLHELRAWLRSPFHRLQDWDQCVQYNETL